MFKLKPLRKKVFILAWPAVIEMLLQMMVGIADIAMVGRLGDYAIAAVGFSNSLVFFTLSVFSAVSVGTTALVARFFGAGNKEMANKVAKQSLMLALFLSILLSFIFLFFGEDILKFMMILMEEPDYIVLKHAIKYINTVAISLPLGFLMLMVNSILRGTGDTKTPMIITSFVNVLNILGNFLLIFGYFIPDFKGLGVWGAAISTAFSRGLGGIIVLIGLFTGKFIIRLKINENYSIDWIILKRILRIGIPAALEQLLMRSGQMIFGIIVAGLGTTAYAANQVVLNAESLSFMPGFAFALAATTLVGQYLGKGSLKRAEVSGYEANKLAIYIMSVMGVIFYFQAENLVGFFTNDLEVIKQGALSLKIVALAQPALATTMVLAGALRGAGDVRYVLFISAAGIWLVRLPLAYLFGITWGYALVGAWMAITIDLFIRGVLTFIRFKTGKWKFVEV